jgi:hypothetical protein
MAKLYLEDPKIILWQNYKGHRRVIPVQIDLLNVLKDEIHLSALNPSDLRNLDEGVSIYLNSPFLSLLFKTDVGKLTSEEAILKMPSEIKVLEHRRHPRHFFKGKKLPYMTLLTPKDHRAEQSSSWENYIFDISSSGASIWLFKKYLDYIKVDEAIIVKRINGQPLGYNQEFIVRNINEVNYKKDGESLTLIRVGGEFRTLIDVDLYFPSMKKWR